MRNYKQITFVENRHRRQFLVDFIRNYSQYVSGLRHLSDEQLFDLRTKVNLGTSRAKSYVMEAGEGFNFHLNRYALGGIWSMNVDVFSNLFNEDMISDIALSVLDATQKTVGTYEADYALSIVRTFNPFFWFAFLAESLLLFPFLLLFGGGRPKGSVWNFLSGIVKLVCWLVPVSIAIVSALMASVPAAKELGYLPYVKKATDTIIAKSIHRE